MVAYAELQQGKKEKSEMLRREGDEIKVVDLGLKR